MPNYYLFRSSEKTHQECLDRMLVGQRNDMSQKVEQVKVGDIIFIHKTSNLRNVMSQYIEGPFWAVTNGQESIEPDAYNGDFQWQVKIEKKGDTVKIKQDSFRQFQLHYSFIKIFFPFKLYNQIGRKLMEAVGLTQDPVKRIIIDYDAVNEIDVDFRLKYPANYRCQDGHYVRSRAEIIVDNWFYTKGIAHCYEKKIPGQKMICDFYLIWKGKEYYIEVWGGMQDPEENRIYQERKKQKIKIYEEQNINLLSLDDRDIKNVEDKLSDYFN